MNLNLDYYRGKVKAVRVGVQPHARVNDLSGAIARPQIHVGHAKTFLHADLIAKELDVPLWVRYKWAPETLAQQVGGNNMAGFGSIIESRARVLRYVETLLVAKDELSEMLGFFGITPERFYLPPTATEVPDDWRARILATCERVSPGGGWGWDPQTEWYDAAVGTYPVLMVRGADWCPPNCSSGTAQYVAIEDAVFAEADHEKFVVHLPLIMCGREKMSSSRLNAVPWWILTPLGRERVFWWLAGAQESKQWNWHEWLDACRNGARP